MATLAALKKKLAALEAQVEMVTKSEMTTAIKKVRKIMDDYGMTVEHLASAFSSGRGKAKTASSKAAGRGTAKAKVKGSKPPKYRDPASGMTWAGVGRAPAWIAGASNRDEFLINKPAGAETDSKSAAPAKKASKRAASSEVAKGSKRAKASAPAKKGARKTAASKKAATTTKATTPRKAAAAKKVSARKAAAPKAAASKAATKRKSTRKTSPAANDAGQAATPAAAS